MIEDLMDPNIQHGELGMMFTTLKVSGLEITFSAIKNKRHGTQI